jgi:hypothetical protein
MKLLMVITKVAMLGILIAYAVGIAMVTKYIFEGMLP